MTYRSVNPFDGSVLETFQEIDDDQLERALQTAHRCFGDWRSRTFSERGAVLTGAAIALSTLIGTNPADNMAAPPDAATARMNSRRELRGAGTPVLSSK